MVAAIERNWTIDELVDILAYAQSLPTGLGGSAAPAPATEAPPATLP